MERLSLLGTIAWRNLWRHPRRTVLTALGLGLGLALLLISIGLGDGGHAQMIENGVRLGSGHVVVQARGYQESRAQDLLLPQYIAATVQETLADGRGAGQPTHVSPRLLASGLLSSAAHAAGVTVIGVAPQAERAVSLIPGKIIEGTYLSDAGHPGIVIGEELARKLAVRIGSRVVLMTQALRQPQTGTPGNIHSALFRVSGIFRTGLRDVDAYVVHLPLPQVQELLGVPAYITQVAVFLSHDSATLPVARRLRQVLASEDIEVLTWPEALRELAQFVWLDDAFNYVMLAVILAMVGLGLLNTMLMAVLERRYELGVCAALGLQPGQLAAIVLYESLALTVLGVGIGLLLGLGGHWYFATTGLDLRWFTEIDLSTAGTVFDPILYSRLSLSRLLWSVAVVFLMAVVLAVYPALQAAHTRLPDALRVL
ncbi:MAG: ABC transporter permease [Candidatus Binatia bacterium]|nr:ABC transporter permease [Candidatus Binatia bacterium]